ncbi:MAG: hypothetical protein F4206_15815 [Gammaproteobacteria bacterium]|nr:hypothetical protein [Gammaproteobacteria bacterium]MYG68174.1 hypothetical protein [Gammaproteobacteria bacterium]
MKKPADATDRIASRAAEDSDFRARLVMNPKETIARDFGVTLDEDHEIHVHEETYSATHLVIPPHSKYSEAERKEAKAGATSLEFLRRTLHDPAPPMRPPAPERVRARKHAATPKALAKKGRESILRGLAFLESVVDESGAWHCIRFNIADPDIPRHFEKPPFISALCVLALESSDEARARALCDATRKYLVSTIEYPGLWRYYRHLPQDLDSTTVCSLVIGSHPWVFLGRNVPRILANRDDNGCFKTWMLEEDEPDVVSSFRIEADPVVNANVIAYLGDHPETRDAQRWLEALIIEDRLKDSSKWYPDTVTIYYATTRAMMCAEPALDSLRPILADRILDLGGGKGEFGNLLQTAQAVSALYNIDRLESIDVKRQVERIIGSQREDGSWPELLAFGDQSLRWGAFGQIGHGSESVTTAFCIEALERLVEALEA